MNNLVDIIINKIQLASKFSNLKGWQKKEWVILALMEDIDFGEDIEDFLGDLIDVIIDIDKGKISINKKCKQTRGWCF